MEEKLFSGIGLAVSGLIKKNTDTEATSVIIGPQNAEKIYKYDQVSGSSPTSVVSVFGMDDTVISYDGGEAKTGYTIFSAEDNI